MEIAVAGTGNTVAIIVAVLIIGYFFYNFIKSKKQLERPPSENVNILTDTNFNSTIKSGITLVDFWAAWCGPCRVQGPIIDEVADELHNKATIGKLNIDENKKTAQMLGIQSIPTLLLFKDGKIIKKFVGVKPKGTLIKAINEIS
jgi:thioredoxin 1